MTKNNLSTAIHRKFKRFGVQKELADTIVDQVFDEIRQALIRKEAVSIPRFGVFENRTMSGANSRNPRTGVEISKEPFNRPWFRAARDLKAIVN